MKIPQRSLLITPVMRAPFCHFRRNLWLLCGVKERLKKINTFSIAAMHYTAASRSLVVGI